MNMAIQKNSYHVVLYLLASFMISALVTVLGLVYVHWSIPFLVLLVGGLLINAGSEAKRDGDEAQASKLISIGIVAVVCPIILLIIYALLVAAFAGAWS